MMETWWEGILGGQTSASIVGVIPTGLCNLLPSAVLRAESQALVGLSQEIELVVGEQEDPVKKKSRFEYEPQRPDQASEQALQLVPVLQFPTDCRWTMVLWNDRAWMDSIDQSCGNQLCHGPDTAEEAAVLTFHLRSRTNFRWMAAENLHFERDSAVFALPMLHAGQEVARGHIFQEFPRCQTTPSSWLTRQNERRTLVRELEKCCKVAEHPQS